MDSWSRQHAVYSQESTWYTVSRDTVGPKAVRLVDRTVVASLGEGEIQLQLEVIAADSGVVHLTRSNARMVCIHM